MPGNVFGDILYYVSIIFAKSHEKSHRLWTKNLSLARGLLAIQIKIPLGIHFLGPWEGGILVEFFFWSLRLHPLANLGQTCWSSTPVGWCPPHWCRKPACRSQPEESLQAWCSLSYHNRPHGNQIRYDWMPTEPILQGQRSWSHLPKMC